MDKNKPINFEVIRQKLFDPDGDLIILTDKQQQLLDRWNYVIEKKTATAYKNNDIVSMMMFEFGIERATAFNDIGWAEALFGFSTPLNKRFRLGARINYIEEYIENRRKAGDHVTAAVMESTLLKYYKEYPDSKPQNTPTQLRFVYRKKQELADNIPNIEEAELVLIEAAKNG